MRFGHRVTGKITGYDEKGRGSFSISEPPTQQTGSGDFAIPFAALGDEVTATFIKRDHGQKICRLESVQTPGPDRVTAPCPHAGSCGGCLWQHLSYDAQAKLKLDMVNKAFESAGHAERLASIVPAKEHFHQRNRMDYCVGWNGEIGLKEYGSWNRYVDVKTCLLLNDGAGDILQQVREWMKAHDLLPWDAKFYRGDVRYVVVREGKRTGQRLIVVVVHALDRVKDDARADLAARLSPFATSVLLGEQALDTDISLAQTFVALKGEPHLDEVCGGITYRIHPNSFFQTNTVMAEVLQQTVENFVIPAKAGIQQPKHLLDLYCGLGFFGIAFAKHHPELKVSGFELDAPAIELAKLNAQTNGVAERCDFTAGPAEDLSWKDIPADSVILDPPRAGLHPKVLKTVLEMAPPTLVYVSCNFHRLVQELVQFKEKYDVERLVAIDMFPHTPHIEVIARLIRR